ncbi:MAG: LCP family protein [Acetatifactor sp.]|nr:LCP family protein [Acetatifactor sp.]
MAANAKNNRKNHSNQQQTKNKRKLIIFGAELIIIVIMVGVLWWVMDFTEDNKAPHITEKFEPGEVKVPQQVQQQIEQGGAMKGYMNIALFGVDAKNENELYKSSRSDTIMIASINLDTGDIKLVSVLRDTYLNLNQGDDTYKKCNAAYAKGGAQQAVGMLNMNLDMDITQFVTVGYAGLAEVIDGLGGVWIDVSKAELQHINNYQYSILGKYAKTRYNINIDAELNFTPDEYFWDYDMVPVKEPGYQLLDGLQAAAYCRIRYVGNDFERTARQREVIKAIEAQAKQADLATLTKVFESAMDDIYTNLDAATILTDLLPNIAKYRIADEGLFPERDKQEGVNMGANGICQIPNDLAASVSWLHGFLFDDNDYVASDTVKNISDKIIAAASKYRGGN